MTRKDVDRPRIGLVKQAPQRGLDARSLEQIGSSLKAHYEDLVRTPVPTKFLELLERLEAKEQSQNVAGTGDNKID